MAGAVAGGEILADLVVEGQQADGVALLVEEEGERGGEGIRVGGLCDAARAEVHRATVVSEEVAAEVGFVLELLDEVAVAPGEEFPIEIARVVAGRVLAILGELDAKAVIRAAMNAAPKALDHNARPHLQTADGHERLRVNQLALRAAGLVGGRNHCGVEARTCSTSFAMTLSTVTPSASAR